jgi:hypothetical protein
MDRNPVRFSAKSTKDELLKAYNELVAKQRDKTADVSEKKAEMIKAAEVTTVEKASAYTMESIIKGLADLNLNVGKALTEVASHLTAEANKLSEIRSAISIETRNIEELHGIRIVADTLALLIKEYEEKKAAFEAERAEAEEQFEAEMAEKKAEWKKEQESYNVSVKENEVRLKKDREREREDYEYNLALTRKKDKDLYEEQKAKLQKELNAQRLEQELELTVREAAIAGRESELSELRSRAAAFPAALTSATEQAEKEAVLRTESRLKHEEMLRIKEAESDRRVAELTVVSLQETASKQAAQIELLTKKLEDANTQVQAIAVKAIEGASNARALTTINEIAMEQAKNISRKS